jgi:hypothetical protein
VTHSARLYGIGARILALTMAGWTAAFVLFSPTSIAARVAGDSLPGDVLNAGIIALCLLGWADVIWHDVRGRLIWPSLPMQTRHRICVLIYSVLAGLTGLRAFVAAGSDKWEVLFLGTYYMTCAIGIALVAVALALEPRHAPH